MSDALSTLSAIASDGREFAETARNDGFDPADAVDLIEDTIRRAETRAKRAPTGSNLVVAAILMQDGVCDDVLDVIERCFDIVVREPLGARAVRDRLKEFVDAYGPSDAATSVHPASATEDVACDRAARSIRRIDSILTQA